MVSKDVNNINKNFKGKIIKYIHGKNYGFIKMWVNTVQFYKNSVSKNNKKKLYASIC